jgi:predicted metal-dependent hydrolase
MPNRKHIRFEVVKENEINVKVPIWFSNLDVEKILQSEHTSLIKLIESAKGNLVKEKQFVSGEKFLYLGEERELEIVENNKYAFRYDKQKFYIDKSYSENGLEYFANFYKGRSQKIIKPRVYEIASQYNLPVNNVKISSARTRWGSCSGKRNINIAWRLIQAPPRVIDSVIAHELVHLIHMNHSKDFYAILRKIIPDLDKCDLWLKENQKHMAWI